MRWKDVPIIITSNSLPDVVKPKGKNDEGYYDYRAFATRIKYHKLTESYKNTSKFPYTVEDLAAHLSDLVESYNENEFIEDDEDEEPEIEKEKPAPPPVLYAKMPPIVFGTMKKRLKKFTDKETKGSDNKRARTE